jgi:hypothetical protein
VCVPNDSVTGPKSSGAKGFVTSGGTSGNPLCGFIPQSHANNGLSSLVDSMSFGYRQKEVDRLREEMRPW